jgi:hypothetical protein
MRIFPWGNIFPFGFGVGVPSQTHPNPYPILDLLEPDWWYDWGKLSQNKEVYPKHPKWSQYYYPMMYGKAKPLKDSKFSFYKSWLLFNEPNQHGQHVLSAHQAAYEAWTLWSYGAKRLVVGNEIIAPETEYDDRLGWYTGYLRHGGPIPEVWGIHLYVWNKTDPPNAKGVRNKINRFKRWMEAKNVVRPIVVTEVSALGGPYEDQLGIMKGVIDVLHTGEIQAAAWFSAGWWRNHPDNLVVDGKLTALGRVFKDRQW